MELRGKIASVRLRVIETSFQIYFSIIYLQINFQCQNDEMLSTSSHISSNVEFDIYESFFFV